MLIRDWLLQTLRKVNGIPFPFFPLMPSASTSVRSSDVRSLESEPGRSPDWREPCMLYRGSISEPVWAELQGCYIRWPPLRRWTVPWQRWSLLVHIAASLTQRQPPSDQLSAPEDLWPVKLSASKPYLLMSPSLLSLLFVTQGSSWSSDPVWTVNKCVLLFTSLMFTDQGHTVSVLEEDFETGLMMDQEWSRFEELLL